MKPGLFAILLAVTAGVGAPQPEFEVASVKVTNGNGPISMKGGPGTADPGRVSIENFDLRKLLTKAYGVESDQISGPSWIDSDRYTITARIPAGTTQEQFQTMLQNLLAERFKLAIHHEPKEPPVYELTIAKAGPKLTSAAAGDPHDVPPEPAPDIPTPAHMKLDKEGCPVARPGVSSGSGSWGPGVTCSRFVKTSIAQLANTVSQFIAMEDGSFGTGAAVHVIDRTGLEGEYDITLKFHLTVRFPGQASNSDPADGPDISTALEQQLGLKLVRTKTTLDRIVVDQANRVPTEN
jgi:uncharacterized protein (TIGR03435 family)